MTVSGKGAVLSLLEQEARERPDRIAYTFVEPGERETGVSPGSLRAAALALAQAIAARAPDADRAVLGYPSGRRYLEAVFACLYAGVTPISGHVAEFGRAGAVADGLARTARATGARVVLVRPRLAAIGRETAPELAWVEDGPVAPEDGPPRRRPPELAYVQTTSGSTGAQKGVALGDANLLANLRAQAQLYPIGEGSVTVSWLPMSHDMGFVGPLLQPLYSGSRSVFLPPLRFVADPLSWLRAMARHRAEISGCPNFGYDHVLRCVSAAELAGLDLSAWRCAISGGEPIRPETLERFAATLRGCGFEPTAFVAGYGLAEATSVVTAVDAGAPVRVRCFDRDALQRGEGVPASAGRRLVGLGAAAAGHTLAVVDPETREPLAERRVGEIWVAGPSVGAGYLGASEEEENAVFHAALASGEGPYLRTGDEGFLFEGELFLTGRSRELILVRGVNHAPQDLEATAREAGEALARSRLAAAALPREDGEEGVLLAVELDEPLDGDSLDRLAEGIRLRVAERHGIEITDLVFLPPGSVPLTGSGKVRRRELGRRHLDGELRPAALAR
ncbi:MAG TPA: AMP-binding protein [Solirubrobacterales bacterium]|nr:AMP-binding protein [Solirubrobacterales bacterium]